MTGEVVSLKGDRVESDRRRQFMEQIAASFDLYTETYETEPEAFIFTLSAIRGTSQVGWLMMGEAEGAGTTMLALAAAHLNGEVGRRVTP